MATKTKEEYEALLKEATARMLDNTTNEMKYIKATTPDRQVGDIKDIEDIKQSIGISSDNASIKTEGDILKRNIPKEDEAIAETFEKQNSVKPQLSGVTNNLPSNFPKLTRKFDLVPLVTKGECYPHKKTSIAVYYLSAKEENLITSLNLYRDGLLIDAILQNVIADPDINPDELVQTDIDAILLFLRTTGYGVELPITTDNPYTGETISTKCLLSDIKYKDFDLVGDENGWFKYTTRQGDIIKFGYPDRGDLRIFNKMVMNAESSIIANRLNDITKELGNLNADIFPEISKEDITKLETAINTINLLQRKISNQDNAVVYSNVLTTHMAMIIKTVTMAGTNNEIMDRVFIKEYIENMLARDARDFRAYVEEHAPKLDYNVRITIPEGHEHAGEILVRELTLDETIFLNTIQ